MINLRFKIEIGCLVFLFISMIGCMNPMGSLKPEIEEFKKQNPKNFGYVNIEDRKVHYVWSGDKSKPALVFVHGSPGSWEGWVKYLNNEALKEKFHIIAIDRPGYGPLDKGKTEHSLKNQAKAVEAVLKENQSLKPAILVGHSFGGPVVAETVLSYDLNIGGVIFIASSVDPSLEKTKWIQYPATWWPIRVIIPKAIRVCNEEIMSLKAELELQAKLWDNLKSKVIIIQGKDDTLVPAGNTDFLIEKIKPELIFNNLMIDNMGHFVIWQKPELIIENIFALEKAINDKE